MALFKLQKGNVNSTKIPINGKDIPEIDSAKCSVKCNNISTCESYEYYGRSCKLYDTSNVTREESSGYFNCKRIGELHGVNIWEINIRNKYFQNNDIYISFSKITIYP